MFEQTFVQGAGELRKPWTMAASFTGQLIVIGAVLAVPLLQTARIAWEPPLILYAPLPRVEPPVKVSAHGNPQAAVSILRAVFRPRFTALTHVPAKIALMSEDPAPAIGAISNFDSSGIQTLPFASALAQPKPVPETLRSKPKPTMLRTSTGVQQAMLIHEVKPAYPPLARAARISGTVRLAAIIARDGSIQNLQLISGAPMLVKAAIEAVRQWRYKPTTLSGEPVEVITEIDVNFTLSN